MIQELLYLIGEIFYPSRCLKCKKEITDRGVLCPVCRFMLHERRFFRGLDYECKFLDGFFIYYRYEGSMREALLQAKFFHRKSFVKKLAVEMENLSFSDLAGVWNLSEDTWVVPIPTDKNRAKARGFDLPQEVFHSWTTKEKLKWKLCLERIKGSEPQFGLNQQARKKNVIGCWQVCEAVVGRHILLVDDIFTTGATMNEAARCLKEAGAAKVYAVALSGGKK